ncbi:CocE/NonD family hydrolase [Phototrophicus methaneseepsis]|uniref:CocE/NonD family hydrolase n=1 Tax=Phototrophicus methaneseepsis TaxID=2710758 RepID=A0A7S8ECQ0_9CHLR|nr:CocE/NonD family hydrolase [Phototrophicus methaneseepsis]QPC84560.1 CocE/NonD family hydrolase [Phototrophicus methaneseepsis]
MSTIVIEKNMMVSMRDGVALATDVYRLEDTSPAPVLLARTPYNKEHIVSASGTFDIMRAVQAGYVIVVQDVRGRYASEGQFNPHFQEADDGVDAIAWAAKQSWSTGVVGTFGGSYLGCTQWIPAMRQPPALTAMAPSITPSDMYEGMAYQGGAKVLHDLRWVVDNIIPAEIQRRAAQGDSIPENTEYLDFNTALSQIPLGDHPLIQEYASFYSDWLAHQTADTYWHPASPCTAYEQINVPALNFSGWYDIFLWSAFENYMGMKARGNTEHARRNQKLIIGPWSHSNFSGTFPEREFGPSASSHAIDLTDIQLRWFDRWLKGIDNHIEQEPSVMFFVMGIDEWRTSTEWPLPDTQYRSYYLHSSGQANTRLGDGTLSETVPEDESPDTYLYNPLRPVPTMGGQVLMPGGNVIGPRDQRDVEMCDDVFVYSTPVLDHSVEVTGPVELCLFVASSARDTDFTGKLVDVYPDGRAIILTEGILRARYRHSFTEPECLQPDVIYELRLNLWATSNVFLPGHRIRLEVSSSNFPRFDRNSNTGGAIEKETADQYRSAINRVFHDAEHPSRLILPIIP